MRCLRMEGCGSPGLPSLRAAICLQSKDTSIRHSCPEMPRKLRLTRLRTLNGRHAISFASAWELRQANEILRTASAYFAMAEFDCR